MGIDIELWRARIGLFNGGRGCRPRKRSHQLSCGEMASTSSVDAVAGLLTLICLVIVWGVQQIVNIGKKRNHISGQSSSPVNAVCGVSINGALLLFSLAYLLIVSGDVELNPGPGMGEIITMPCCTFDKLVEVSLVHQSPCDLC